MSDLLSGPTEEGSRPPRSLSSFCPWPRCCPWLLIVVGVAVGTVVGMTPWLFVGIGLACLLSGCWPQRP